MRRIRLGWCMRRGSGTAGHTDHDERELRRADDNLDAIGAREPVSSDDPVLRALGALAADVDEDLPPRAPGGSKRRRRLASRAVLATGLTVVALSGTGMAAATVVGGVDSLQQPIQWAVQGLYKADDTASPAPTRASESSAGVEGALRHSRRAMSTGDLADAQQSLRVARTRLEQLDTPKPALAREIDSMAQRLASEQAAGGSTEDTPAASQRGSEATGGRSSTPAEDTPAGDTPAGGTPAGDTPAGDTPRETAPTETPTTTSPASPGDDAARPHNREGRVPAPAGAGEEPPTPPPASPSLGHEPGPGTTDPSTRTHRSIGRDGSGKAHGGDDAGGTGGPAPTQRPAGIGPPGTDGELVPPVGQD